MFVSEQTNFSTSFIFKKDINKDTVGSSNVIGSSILLSDVQENEQKECQTEKKYTYIKKSRLQELEFLEQNLSTIIQAAVNNEFEKKKTEAALKKY